MISVIIPVLNEEEYLPGLLNSLSVISKANTIEVIVVDGGSTDNSIKIAEENSLCTTIKSKHSSRAHQMNFGAEIAKGDILYFVHADVKVLKSFTTDIQEAIGKGYQSGCYRYKFDRNMNPLLYVNGFFTRFPFEWCRGGDQTLFITKEVFNEIGGFDEKYVIMEDYDIIRRIKRNFKFCIIPKSVTVSSRKYRNNSYLKVQSTNLKAMKMFKKGIEPRLIRDFYSQALK